MDTLLTLGLAGDEISIKKINEHKIRFEIKALGCIEMEADLFFSSVELAKKSFNEKKKK